MKSTPGDVRVVVQLVFSLRDWTPRQARLWAASRGFKTDLVRINDYSIVIKQRLDSEVVPRSAESEVLAEGLHAVTGRLRLTSAVAAGPALLTR